MSLGKKGNIVIDNTVELIIAGAGIVILIILLFTLYSPTYDENAERAKSYFQMFKEQVRVADFGVEGSVTFWGPEVEGVGFYLVYFGELSSFEKESLRFTTRRKNENTICVCHGNEDKMICGSCKDLDLEAEDRRSEQ